MQHTSKVRLTGQVKAGGCASKLSPSVLEHVLRRLPKQQNSQVLVGFETSDDAGIYQLTDELALVQTVDFFTPMVDDPFTYGQIAATNALSDVYAMGGSPISALAVLAYPESGDLEVLEAMMAGGLSKMAEAGCAVIGGHSVKDSEMKFGYAVTGTVHPQRIFKNKGAQPGDRLFFTKAIGTGVITTALKRGLARPEWIQAAIRSMTTLNRRAVQAIVGAGLEVHAMTDVTGFGLAGHAREMALASDVALCIDLQQTPLLDGALACVRAGSIPAGLVANRAFVECLVNAADSIEPDRLTLFFDPQTAGGLLISVAPRHAEKLQSLTAETGTPAVAVGEVIPRGDSGKVLKLI